MSTEQQAPSQSQPVNGDHQQAEDILAPKQTASTPPAPAASAEPPKPEDKGAPAADKPKDEQTAKPDEKPANSEELKLVLPEGSQLDASHVEKVALFAKEKGLSQEQAQAILNRESDAVTNFQAAQLQAFEERKEAWKTEVMNDKELGGDNMAKNVELAHRALKHFGGEKLMQELDVTGYGNHPEVVRVFARIGKAMGEDKLFQPGSQASAKKSLADVFYGESN